MDWYREEDPGYLRRSELNELVENMTVLNAFEERKMKNEKSWKFEKCNQKIAMDEKFVTNSVMNAKIDDMFKIGGWNNLQRNQHGLG